MITDSDFKEIIQREGSANPPMEMIDRVLGLTDTITLRPGGILIPFGKIDTDLYIVRDRVLQLLYLVKEKEQIFGSAEDRYMNLLRHRLDIVNSISSKRLAQYLNVTPSLLCKIRKKLLYE